MSARAGAAFGRPCARRPGAHTHRHLREGQFAVITLGIDIGTSAVKVALVRDDDQVVASASRSLTVSGPRPGWSEQDPQHWWQATCDCLDELKAQHGAVLAETRAIGLSGQMHGATLLGARGETLRPCILWND